jgi:NAD(P)-dependent dehydrogenase (short-subunit alcohol dehydrogenase family)
MSWDPAQLGPQDGRAFVVTGANSGIGFATARALVDRGAHVVLAVRNTARGDEAAGRLSGRGSTSAVELDLADLDQVADATKRLLDDVAELTGLICNAGVMGGLPLVSAQGFELQMATNHLGHAALVEGLWSLLHASASRVVVLSSNEAKRGTLSRETTRQQLLAPDPYDGTQVYRNTKQANLLFAQELHRRCARAGSPVSAVAVHPGAVSTNLFARQFERSGRARLGRASKAVTSVLLRSPEAGARCTLRALDPATPSGSFVAPSGLAQLRGEPELAEVYPSGNDPATGAALWDITEQVIGGAPMA